MICEKCGTTEGVEEVLDPYALDINGVEVWCDLCSDCYADRVADI
jgi:hypothetical protein